MKNKNRQIIFLIFNILVLNTWPVMSQTLNNSAINRPNLQIGSQGNIVSELQAILRLLGYYQGKVDGNYSEELQLAVSRFQKAAGLTTTGIVDDSTWKTLLPLEPPVNNSTARVNKPNNNNTINSNQTNSNQTNNSNNTTHNNQNQPQPKAENMPLLKEGMSGEAVKILQQRLKRLGVFQGTIDGVFGAETREAVIAAQAKFKLGADGIVGYQTWKALLGQ